VSSRFLAHNTDRLTKDFMQTIKKISTTLIKMLAFSIWKVEQRIGCEDMSICQSINCSAIVSMHRAQRQLTFLVLVRVVSDSQAVSKGPLLLHDDK
jgi:hypothetical protein